MKMLVLTPGILPENLSGIGTNVFYLSRQIRRLAHEVVILTAKHESHPPPYEEKEGMFYHRMPLLPRSGYFDPFWPLIVPFQSRRWQKKLRTIYPHIDVVWVQNPWWTLLLDPRKLWPEAKVVFHLHCDPYSELTANNGHSLKVRAFGRLYDRITIRTMKRADRILVHSQYTKKIALAMCGEDISSKLMIVPGGADTRLYAPATPPQKDLLKKKLSLPSDRPAFLTVRGLKKRTGVDKLVRATALLKKSGVLFTLTIVGKGPEKEDILRSIQSNDLGDCVRLVSDLTENELTDYYRASDVFVLPSQAAEGFGIATVEALSSGLVVLGTHNGATPEILDLYKSEWLIPGCDEESIFRKMADFCSHPERFAVLPEKIREITEKHFSWPVAAQKFIEGLNGRD